MAGVAGEARSIVGDSFTNEVALSLEELQTVRAGALRKAQALGCSPVPEKFTCDDCARAPVCALVFDLYNTNGDCLWEK